MTNPLLKRLMDQAVTPSIHDEAQASLAVNDLIEAALDQRAPSEPLKRTLNAVLLVTDHPLQPTWRRGRRIA